MRLYESVRVLWSLMLLRLGVPADYSITGDGATPWCIKWQSPKGNTAEASDWTRLFGERIDRWEGIWKERSKGTGIKGCEPEEVKEENNESDWPTNKTIGQNKIRMGREDWKKTENAEERFSWGGGLELQKRKKEINM